MMRDKQGLLSRAECNAMRGLAIIGIFLHNYCHWLRGIVRENEYQFFIGNVEGLRHATEHPDMLLPVHLLSFFGHYGVPVFLFLSAYGLVLKYESSPALTGGWAYYRGAWDFIRRHFVKLFKMMVVGFVAFTMVDAITRGAHHYHFLDVAAQLLMVNNVLPEPDQIIWPGPYWFFGLMLQLYVVYRLLLYRRHWGGTVALIAVCTVIQMACEPEGEALNRWRYNFVGGMLPFGMGLLYARFPLRDNRTTSLLLLVASVMLVWWYSGNYYSWFFVPAFVVAAAIYAVKLLPQCVNGVLEWMGGISAALFVCHPIARKIFIPLSHRGDVYAGLLLYVVASIVLACLFREVMKKF